MTLLKVDMTKFSLSLYFKAYFRQKMVLPETLQILLIKFFWCLWILIYYF